MSLSEETSLSQDRDEGLTEIQVAALSLDEDNVLEGLVGMTIPAKEELSPQDLDSGESGTSRQIDEHVDARGQFGESQDTLQTGKSDMKLESSSKLKHEDATHLKHEGDKSQAEVGNSSTEQLPGNLHLVAKTIEAVTGAQEALAAVPPDLPRGSTLILGAVVEPGTTAGELPVFDFVVYLGRLETRSLGHLLLFSSRLPSTHSILSQNFKSFPAGSVCVADVQYHGKGRGGNVWESPRGCLMFSFTLQEENGRTLPFLQYVVSLAVVQAIEDLTATDGKNPLEVRIKWPNDLYANDMKIGGVLCTSTYSDKKFNVTIGVGLNVANEKPTTCLNDLLEMKGGRPSSVSREELLAVIMCKFELLHDTFLQSGFHTMKEAYLQHWLHTNQKVTLEEDGSSVLLTIKGLTEGGYLLATNESGEQFELHPDGNSLDFFQGLVRKKLPG